MRKAAYGSGGPPAASLIDSIGSPIALSSQISCPVGGKIQFPTGDLRLRVTVPYLIDSIRMAVWGATQPNAGVDNSWRGVVKWSFTYGRIMVTYGFIPMWLFAPVRQTNPELGGYFHWVLPRPLLMTPGSALAAEIMNPLGPSTANAFVSYVGRTLSPNADIPNEIDVPYVSAWDTTNAQSQVPAGQFFSDNNSLVNLTQRTLEVQHVIGRIQSNNATDGDDTTKVQLLSYDGRQITSPNGLWQDVFPAETRMLHYRGVLPQGQYIQARLTTQPSTSYQPMISLIGCRKEATP